MSEVPPSLRHSDAAAMLAAASTDPEPVGPGARLGDFVVTREIGRGTFGVVYEARQDAPLERTVAIKVIRLDALGASSTERFLREQRLLSRLSHPCIAQVFGSGTLEDGRPWFAMELVPGMPLDRFCHTRSLPVVMRLRLLAEACDAVAHAHRRGVLHRDLKPANALAGEIDGVAAVKIVDFGVSRDAATGAPSSESTTEFGEPLGTPEFMSPEVAALGGATATEASDLYALGVLACCTLAGGLPIEPGDARTTPIDERLRRIRLQPPSRPSAIARRIGTPAVPWRLLRGDIDALVQRCLEKDPARRPASAEALARDLRKLAAGESIELPGLGPVTRLVRAVHAHRVGLGLAAMVVVPLVLATIVSVRAAGSESRARESAERALAEAQAADARTSEVVVGLWQAIGPVRNRIQFGADSDRNVAMMRAMRDLFVQVFGPEHPRTDTAIREYARALSAAGRLQEAGEAYLAALPGWEARGGADHPKLVPVRTEVAECLRKSGQPARAIPLFEAVLRQSDAMGPPYESPVQAARRGLSICLSDVGRHDEAIAVATEAARRLTLMPPPDPMDRAFLDGVLASAFRFAGRRPEAEEIYRDLLSPERQARIKSHPQFRLATGAWAGELGMLLQVDDRRDEARPWIAMGLRLMRDEASRANPTARWLRENAGCYGLCDDGSAVPADLADRIDP